MTSIQPGAAGQPERSRADVAADEIREWLTTGALGPGQQIPEEATAERLEISRNTLREAFRQLEHDRLVEHRPHRGVFVATPSTRDVADIYRIRRHLECGALAGATRRHPGVARMREQLELGRRAAVAGDWAKVGTANMAFHSAILGLADSPRIEAFAATLMAELRLVFRRLPDQHALHEPYIARNAEILEHAEAGRFGEAARALDAYLSASERNVVAALDRSGSGAAQLR